MSDVYAENHQNDPDGKDMKIKSGLIAVDVVRVNVKDIRERHNRIDKLLAGAPGMILGPMDGDAAHDDRRALLAIYDTLTWECRGDCGREVSAPMRYCLNCQIEQGITDTGDDAPLPESSKFDEETRLRERLARAEGVLTLLRSGDLDVGRSLEDEVDDYFRDSQSDGGKEHG